MHTTFHAYLAKNQEMVTCYLSVTSRKTVEILEDHQVNTLFRARYHKGVSTILALDKDPKAGKRAGKLYGEKRE